VGYPVHEQPADAVGALQERNRVTGARQLLRAGEARWTRTDHRHPFSAALPWRLRCYPPLAPRMVDDVLLDQLDGDGVVVDVEDAGFLARCRAYPPGKLRKVVGRVQAIDGIAPAPPVNQVIPVGDDVPERATLVAEGNPAIHAAGALRFEALFGQLEI